MDIGVIIAGAIVGLAIFREKLSLLNFAGIGLGVLAIIINSFHDSLTRLFTAIF
jgi:multidrug transporter EmrE-like cation transporter